ncbi:MAG: hypothetical protein JNL01_09110 [Bdellovibrionales bacterium]|nr:hypothetical protein [Bdellovibrionales bacterium]
MLLFLPFLFAAEIISPSQAAVVPLVEVTSKGKTSVVKRSPAITGPATEMAKNPGENGVVYPNGTTKKQKALTPVYSWSRQSLKKKKRSN